MIDRSPRRNSLIGNDQNAWRPSILSIFFRTAILAALILINLGYRTDAVYATCTETVSVSGAVTKSDGRAVNNAIVYVRHGPENDYSYASRRVNGDGSFEFLDLRPGLIIAAAFADGLSVGGQSRMMVQPGQRAVNVHLVLSKPDTLRVSVVDSTGQPVVGARLSQLMWQSAESQPVWLPEPFLRRVKIALPISNEHGELIVPWIPLDAQCSVRVAHEDFAIGETPTATTTEEPATLVLDRGQRLTIRVMDVAANTPAKDAVVSVMGAALSPFEQSERRVNESGEFVMRVAEARRVSVHVTHPTLATARAYVTWKNQPATVEVPLYRRAIVDGRVVDPAGHPVENVRVSFSIPSNKSLFSSNAVTDREGRYRLDGREGEGTVEAANGRGHVYEGEGILIQLEAGGTTTVRDLVVTPILPIRGVALKPDGTPLPYALVSDRSLPFGGQQVLADKDGMFQLPLVSLPRLATLVIVRHPTRPQTGGMVIPYTDVRQGRTLSIKVHSESTLQGRIVETGTAGRAASGVRVSAEMLVDMGKRKYMLPVASAVTDASGTFRFKGLSRHTRYFVNVTSKGTRGVPDGLIELREAVVELPEPLQVDAADVAEMANSEANANGQPPPLACDTWINSAPLKLNRLRGRVVLIDFWATWCVPCVAELPKLELAHRLYADRGLVLIGVHDNSMSEANLRSFVEQRKISFPIALDNSNGNTVGRYNITTWPTKVLIDRSGNVVVMSRHEDLFSVLRTMLLYD